MLTLLDNSPHAGRREDPAKPEAASTDALDECALWHKIDCHLAIDHLLLRLRIEADVACYRPADQTPAHQLADSPAGHRRVVGDDGKPAVIGNCQAGWAVMMVAAKRPELFGPIIVAGSPLSYWAGVRGENPMRYTGGLLGGTWLTALMGDLGAGKFDGAWLVSNFENLNPANTYWTKQYNLYAKVDTEAPRYLEFEKWWGGHVLLNAEEMQFIADELFIGNKLATAGIVTADGHSVDLRSIRSPIIVFCSKADNITPPSQALGWILDLYGSVEDIRAHGQTIIYAVHELIGHLGIFVSGSVAKKEHDEFASNIDLIDVLPPGLYEAVMTPKEAAGRGDDDLVGGNYLVRFEARTLDDIRAFGGNSVEYERQFAAVARISEINLGLYRAFMQPWVKAWANTDFAEWMRKMHPLRVPYEMFTPANPFFKSLSAMAEEVRKNRQPVTPDNALWQAQERIGKAIESSRRLPRHAGPFPGSGVSRHVRLAARTGAGRA